MSYNKHYFQPGDMLRADQLNEMDDEIDTLRSEMDDAQQQLDNAFAGFEVTPDGLLYAVNRYGERISNGVTGVGGGGGGGGGSATVTTQMAMESRMDWSAKSISFDPKNTPSVPITVYWSSTLDSVATGLGTAKILIKGKQARSPFSVEQGEVTIDVGAYLKEGTNEVRIQITDAYNVTQYRIFTITCEYLAVTCKTDMTTAKRGPIALAIVPQGSMEKTIHFKLDNTELETLVTNKNNSQIT